VWDLWWTVGHCDRFFLFRILGFSPFRIIPTMFECIYRRRYIIRTIDIAIKYEGRYERNASHFFSETVINIVMKCIYSMYTSFTNVRLFFHRVSFIINIFFSPLRDTLYAGRVKLFAEAPRGLSSVSSPLLKRRTRRLTHVTSRPSSSYTLLRSLNLYRTGAFPL
jgi:hypothetical protein